ncbi:hypothetical protein ACH0R4_RS21715 [Bacillus cytotoxicus]|nr:hypothetical protein [Bacillus cereus group sp. BfR-BA-01492]EMA6345228.1 hypothetical protein [Bacillus cytotoxicus]
MIQDICSKYLSLLSNLNQFSEADVKEKVVVPILTEYLGYKEEWIEREKS